MEALKIYNGEVIGAKNETELNAAKKELLAQPLESQKKTKDATAEAKSDTAEAKSDTEAIRMLDAQMNARQLRVTPVVLAVAAGQTMSLRVRSNCAWKIVSAPANATVTPSARQFGEGSIAVTASDDAGLDGTLVVRSADDSVEATVTLVPEYPPATTEEAASAE